MPLTSVPLSERYLGSSAYAENNLFTCTWSSNNFGELDFNCLYPILYGQYYGTEQLVSSNINALTGYATVKDTNMHIVPYEQFERVIGHFFDIKDETIRAMADNSGSYGGTSSLAHSPASTPRRRYICRSRRSPTTGTTATGR